MHKLCIVLQQQKNACRNFRNGMEVSSGLNLVKMTRFNQNITQHTYCLDSRRA